MHIRLRRDGIRSRLAILAIAAATGAALPAAGLTAAPAGATPDPACTGFPHVSCVFSATGGATAWPVPARVTRLTVIADGASGAGAVSTSSTGGGAGGPGGEYKARLRRIPPGTSLSIFAGSSASGETGGASQSGQGGDAAADTRSNTGGGGGGASTVAVAPYSLANVLVAAGGGGGGGAENAAALTPASGGAGGGSSTLDGANGQLGSPGGRGGTPTGGGAAGTSSCVTAPQDGTQLDGGNGQAGTGCGYAGGGGGSGYFGGGGGGAEGGGGGGSAYPVSASRIAGILVVPVADTSTNTGAGSVTIDYTAIVHHSHLRVWSELSGDTVTLYGLLTGDRTPMQDEPVSFGTLSARFCHDQLTNANGVASCALTSRQQWLVQFWSGYITAYFAGDGAIPPAHAHGFGHAYGWL